MKLSKAVKAEKSKYAELIEFLNGFWAEMYAWERNCEKLDKLLDKEKISHQEFKATIIPQARDIFSRYCSYKRVPDRIRGGTFHFQEPPEYQPKKATIQSITPVKDGYKLVITTGGVLSSDRLYSVKIIKGKLKLLDKVIVLYEDGNLTAGL